MHMNTVFVGITLFTAAITAAIAVADFVPARFVLANSAEVGVPRSWLPALGAAKLAGAAGLVVGLLGLPALGIAAAAGLVVFFVGAVLTHLRAGVLYNIAFPGPTCVCPRHRWPGWLCAESGARSGREVADPVDRVGPPGHIGEHDGAAVTRMQRDRHGGAGAVHLGEARPRQLFGQFGQFDRVAVAQSYCRR